MQATAVYVNEDKTFHVGTFPIPDLAGDEVLIRTHYSGISVGTEFTAVRGTRYYGEFPMVLGYQGTGRIEAVGPEVERFQPGNPVYFRTSTMPMEVDGKEVLQRSGTWASHVIHSEKQRVEPLPEGVDGATASMFVMPAVGLNAVDMAGVRMGDWVAVQGVGLIGLGVVAACFLRGAKPIAIDMMANRLHLARQFGAAAVVNPSDGDVLEQVRAIAGSDGVDVSFEGTGVPSLIDQAISLVRMHGKFVYLAVYGEAPVATRFMPAHHRRLTAYYPCDDGLEPCREAVLNQMALGVLPWHKTISHKIPVEDMPNWCARILNHQTPELLGSVIDWQVPDPV